MIKTFRGLVAHESITRIRLGTNNGLIGYKIKKFDSISKLPGTGSDTEALFQVYTVKPSAASLTVNFDDPTLIAVNYNRMGNTTADNDDRVIILDNVTFNQDIYIGYDDGTGNENSANFYLELEQVKLSVDQATVATLKDMRGRE
jgi:hypothetical protein